MMLDAAHHCPTCGHALSNDLTMRVDLYSGVATCGGVSIKLPPFECIILEALAEAYPAGMRFAELINHLYSGRADGGPDDPANSIRAHICMMRRAMREAGMPAQIKTTWAVGYVLSFGNGG